jgi:tetratricopeptide (TPR) repeat protein
MVKKSGCLLFLLLMILSGCKKLNAQQAQIDSLLNFVKTSPEDTTLVISFYRLSDLYETGRNYEEGLKFGNKAIALAETLEKENSGKVKHAAKFYKAKALTNNGLIHFEQSDLLNALKDHAAALRIKEEIGDLVGIGSSYNNLGNIQTTQGNFAEALKNYFASLKIAEKLDNKIIIVAAYNNIGSVYKKQGNIPEALKNYFTALKIREEIGDKRGIATSYQNIGNVYHTSLNAREALANHYKALKLYEELGDSVGIAVAYTSIGISNELIGKNEEALQNYAAAMKVFKEKGYKEGMAQAYYSIGIVQQKLKQYNDAVSSFNNSKQLCGQIGFKEGLRNVYRKLAEIDSARGNYKGAYEHHKLYIVYRDSLDNEESRKRTIQSQMTFDFEKKEAVATAEHKKELDNQSLLAEEKSRKQNLIIVFVMCGLLLVIVFAALISRSLRLTRKQKNHIEEQKNIVEKQKHEVEIQKQLIEEHRKDIIDSITYARRIQHALLPTEKYIERTFKRLRKDERP